MSQFILDEQIRHGDVIPAIQKWATVHRLCDDRPAERILDDRVPSLLLQLKKPTFITIDRDFWDQYWCHPSYCILFFNLIDDQQPEIPSLLQELVRQEGFRTIRERMGKVARVSTNSLEFWMHRSHRLHELEWFPEIYRGRR